MQVTVNIARPPGLVVPDGAVCRVQIRDVSYIDAAAIVLVNTVEPIVRSDSETLARVRLEMPEGDAIRRENLNVWVHVDLSGSAKVSDEDFLTTQAYPVPQGDDPSIRVEVKAAGAKR